MSTRRDTQRGPAFRPATVLDYREEPSASARPRRFQVSAPAPSFDAPLLLGAQIEARATHPDVADRVFLRHHDRACTFRRYRGECVRAAPILRSRLRPISASPPGHCVGLT